VNSDPQITLWENVKIPGLRERAAKGENDGASITELGTIINEYFDAQIAEADALLDVPQLGALDVQKYGVRKDLLQIKRIELIAALSKIKNPLP